MMYTFKTGLPTVTNCLKLWLVVLVVSLSQPSDELRGLCFPRPKQ